MKKIYLLISTALILLVHSVKSQSTYFGFGIFGHTGTVAATDYLGWENATIPLFFRTNYLAATAGLGNRQIITDGGFGPLGGRIAMGNNLADGFVPIDRLHLNQTAGITAIRFTNNAIGFTANNGLQIVNNAVGVGFIEQRI